jgi:hypothetical protein
MAADFTLEEAAWTPTLKGQVDFIVPPSFGPPITIASLLHHTFLGDACISALSIGVKRGPKQVLVKRRLLAAFISRILLCLQHVIYSSQPTSLPTLLMHLRSQAIFDTYHALLSPLSRPLRLPPDYYSKLPRSPICFNSTSTDSDLVSEVERCVRILAGVEALLTTLSSAREQQSLG